MVSKGTSNNLLALAAIVVILAVVGYGLGLFGGSETKVRYVEEKTTAPSTDTQPSGGTPSPPPASITSQVYTGDLPLYLKSATSGNGVTSKVLALDSRHWKGSEQATRYDIMNILYTTGVSGLKAADGGTPKEYTASSGKWNIEQIKGHVNDEIVIFTYEDTSPGSAENASTAKLMKLVGYNEPNKEWSAEVVPTGDNKWNLYEHADYDWFDGGDTERQNYTYGDGGSADSRATITWYSRANAEGELLVDGAVFMQAPENYTSKFKKLTVSDRNGNSVKFSNVPSKAANYPGWINLASTKLDTPATNFYWYYIDLQDKNGNPTTLDALKTLYETNEKNRLTWELETDTYGTANVAITFNIVQNAHATSTNNGQFTITDDFPVQLSTGSTSNFDTAP